VINGIAKRQFATFLQELAEQYGLNGLPQEDETIIINGKATLQFATFLQNAALAVDSTPPLEGETILEDDIATFPFQSFLDILAA